MELDEETEKLRIKARMWSFVNLILALLTIALNIATLFMHANLPENAKLKGLVIVTASIAVILLMPVALLLPILFNLSTDLDRVKTKPGQAYCFILTWAILTTIRIGFAIINGLYAMFYGGNEKKVAVDPEYDLKFSKKALIIQLVWAIIDLIVTIAIYIYGYSWLKALRRYKNMAQVQAVTIIVEEERPPSVMSTHSKKTAA